MHQEKHTFDISEIHDYLSISMSNYLGPTASSSNYEKIILAMFDNALSPQAVDNEHVVELIASYGVDSYTARSIVNDISITLYRTLNVLRPMIGKYEFVTISLIKDKEVIVEVDNSNEFFGSDTAYNNAELGHNAINEIQDSIDNGDWVPPKLRRFAGY